MATKFAAGKYAIAVCDRCSFRTKLKDLRSLVIKGKTANIMVCSECWEADHPQLHLGEYPVNDPQALRNPRRDTSFPQSRALIDQIYVGVGVGVTVGALTPIHS
jgi:hypothetical protein